MQCQGPSLCFQSGQNAKQASPGAFPGEVAGLAAVVAPAQRSLASNRIGGISFRLVLLHGEFGGVALLGRAESCSVGREALGVAAEAATTSAVSVASASPEASASTPSVSLAGQLHPPALKACEHSSPWGSSRVCARGGKLEALGNVWEDTKQS